MPLDLIDAYGAGIQVHVEDLEEHIAGRGRVDAEARWKELSPSYQKLAVNAGLRATMPADEGAAHRILGTLRSEDGKGVVRVEDRYDTDIDDLWSAITEPGRLARWFGEIAGDLRVGGEFRVKVEATTGFEPVNRGFADLPLNHLGTSPRGGADAPGRCPQ